MQLYPLALIVRKYITFIRFNSNTNHDSIFWGLCGELPSTCDVKPNVYLLMVLSIRMSQSRTYDGVKCETLELLYRRTASKVAAFP